MNTSSSLFARIIDRPRSKGTMTGIAVVLLLLPTGAAALDGALPEFFTEGAWRVSYLPPVLILYVLLIAQLLSRSNQAALQALRAAVLLDDEAYDKLVRQASQIKPAQELAAIAFGIVLGLLSVRSWNIEGGFSWLTLYLYVSVSATYALLAWTVVVMLLSTRLTSALHRQPLRIDLFDTSPFEPIGRQSLVSALVFIGGLSLSAVITFQPENLRLLTFWVVYGLLALIPVLIFFVSMRPTHNVLAAEKRRELERVQRLLLNASRELVARMEEGEIANRLSETSALSAELSALAVYEAHVQGARTWPYNIAQLRTLFFSVLIPIVTVLARVFGELFVNK